MLWCQPAAFVSVRVTQPPLTACCLLQAKPEVGIQFGAGGTSTVGSLAAEGTRDVRQLIRACRAFKEHVRMQGRDGRLTTQHNP